MVPLTDASRTFQVASGPLKCATRTFQMCDSHILVRTPDGATGASEVQLDRVSCTLGGATRPCELHLRDSMTPRDYLGPPFLDMCFEVRKRGFTL